MRAEIGAKRGALGLAVIYRAVALTYCSARFMEPGGFNNVQVPFATFHSVHDTLTDIEGTEAFFERSTNVRNGDKKFFKVGEGKRQ